MEKKPKCEKRWRSATHKECQVVRSNKKFRKDIVQYDLQILIHKYTNSEKFFLGTFYTHYLYLLQVCLKRSGGDFEWSFALLFSRLPLFNLVPAVILDEWKMNILARMKNKQHQLFNYRFARIV